MLKKVLSIIFLSFFLCTFAVVSQASASDHKPKKLVYVLFDLSGSTAQKRDIFSQWFNRIMENLHGGDRIVVEAIQSESALNATYPIDEQLPAYSSWSDNPLIYKRKIMIQKEKIKQKVKEFLKRKKSRSTGIMSAMIPAQQLFEVYPEFHKKILVIMSDMIEESRHYNFMHYPPNKRTASRIIKKEKAAGRLPDLKGVEVYVCGAGGRTTSQMLRIKNFWIAYFKACGASLNPDHYGPALPRFDE